jgi:signal transduction histidine kinase
MQRNIYGRGRAGVSTRDGIRVQVVVDPLAGPVRDEANRLQQVFWNLLINENVSSG